MPELREQTEDFEVRDLRDPAGMGGRDWWAARCLHCRQWISKFDHSASDAENHAVGAQHAC